MTPDELRERMRARPLVIDGGLATELESSGSDISGALWSARVLREDPGAVERAHRAYLTAGAEVIISASYQVSRRGLVAAGGTEAEADALLALSVALAGRARDDVSPGALVAASVGPYGATNHDGSEYRGNYGVPHDELVAFHRERLEPLVAAGPDLLAVETIPDLVEVAALVEALADHPDLAAWVTLTTPDGVRTSAGQPLTDTLALLREARSVVAVGVNCSAPPVVADALAALSGGPLLLAYPNAGQTWDATTEEWSGPAVPLLPAALVERWLRAGARGVGGCCGVGPEGVADLAGQLGGWHSD